MAIYLDRPVSSGATKFAFWISQETLYTLYYFALYSGEKILQFAKLIVNHFDLIS